MSEPFQELADLMADTGLTIKFGLEQQGHIPTIERMLSENRTWDEIGRAIGWHPATALDWYLRYKQRQSTRNA